MSTSPSKVLTVDDHLNTAMDFLDLADQELDSGQDLQGSEKLWGAVTHTLTAVAMHRGMPHGKHFHMQEVVSVLSDELNDPRLRDWFSVAEKFHANFYNGFMYDHQIQRDKNSVHALVARIVDYVFPLAVAAAETPPRVREAETPLDTACSEIEGDGYN